MLNAGFSEQNLRLLRLASHSWNADWGRAEAHPCEWGGDDVSIAAVSDRRPTLAAVRDRRSNEDFTSVSFPSLRYRPFFHE
jgi:hypothetical protein